jgi:hypothetical protein
MARWFLKLAPGYWDEMHLYEDGPDRADLVELAGADVVTFLEVAKPGDFYDLRRGDNLLLRLGRSWDEIADELRGPLELIDCKSCGAVKTASPLHGEGFHCSICGAVFV